jgi:tetratricopeptide (TPR) repeat protein
MVHEIFVGRRDEQARFAGLLANLRVGRWIRLPGRPRQRHEGTAHRGSRVVLVHGLGGSGKSRLLRQFREMATGTLPDSDIPRGRVIAAWLDWADEQREDPGAFSSLEDPGLTVVLNALQNTVITACGAESGIHERARQAFGSYRVGAAQMPEYAARFGDVIARSRQAGSTFTSDDATALAKVAASAGLVVAGHPAGVLGLSPDQLATAARATEHLSAGAVHAVTGRRREDLSPEDYDLVVDPARELTRRVAAGIRRVADARPLIIFLDTGEVVSSRPWTWLRRVMTQTGPNVIWVVGARFETEAEAGPDSPVAQFIRDVGTEHLVLMSPTRFDDSMIGEYLLGRLGGVILTAQQIDIVARFTNGLPLAVSLVAELLGGGVTVEDACRQMDSEHPSTVVSQLARRYLIYAEQHAFPADDPRHDDLVKILGLALAFGDLRSDPELLTTLWAATDPLAAFDDLASRHDFVLPISRRLHDDVRRTLRTDLLDPYRRIVAKPISERAVTLLDDRLTQMRSRWQTLDRQLGHAKFGPALLGKLWHTFWMDNQAGLDLLVATLPVLAVADISTANAAVEIADDFVSTFDDDQRRDLDLMAEKRAKPLISKDPKNNLSTSRPKVRRVKFTLAGLALPTSASSLAGDPDDRQAALMILQGRLRAASGDDAGAVSSLQEAAAQTNSEILRRAISSQAETIATRLVWAGPDGTAVPTTTGLNAARIATQAGSDGAAIWHTLAGALVRMGHASDALSVINEHLKMNGNDDRSTQDLRIAALWSLGHFEEALTACDQVLANASDSVLTHNNRGATLQALGRYVEALAAYDTALSLGHDYVTAHTNRGETLRCLRQYDDALTAYEKALSIDASNASAHENKGILLTITGCLDDALAELDTADALAPHGAGEGNAWAAAILWHRHNQSAARQRFTRVIGRVINTTPFRTAEIEAIALCGMSQADKAVESLREALPLRAPCDKDNDRVLYELLSDPELSGISQLQILTSGEL